MSDRITSHHLTRKAIVYVSQSSAFQLQHNVESRRLQYDMQRRVQDLGWSEVECVDEDLGRSGTSAEHRTGFQSMLSEVCLGRVGLATP